MTQAEQKIMADLAEAAKNAIGYFNVKAQRQLLGLNKDDDDTRQALCNAVGAATGVIVCGNLNRTHETQYAIDLAKAALAREADAARNKIDLRKKHGTRRKD